MNTLASTFADCNALVSFGGGHCIGGDCGNGQRSQYVIVTARSELIAIASEAGVCVLIEGVVVLFTTTTYCFFPCSYCR